MKRPRKLTAGILRKQERAAEGVRRYHAEKREREAADRQRLVEKIIARNEGRAIRSDHYEGGW